MSKLTCQRGRIKSNPEKPCGGIAVSWAYDYQYGDKGVENPIYPVCAEHTYKKSAAPLDQHPPKKETK